MREIKFRAWSVKEKEMIPAYALAFESYEPLCNLLKDTEYIKFMQFTGLHDKNGKEIYEGDILWVTDDDGCTGQTDTGMGEVVFIEGLWYIDGRVSNSLYDINKCFLIEVIGNIYENADLLEGEE